MRENDISQQLISSKNDVIPNVGAFLPTEGSRADHRGLATIYLSMATARTIPRPAGKSAGHRDDDGSMASRISVTNQTLFQSRIPGRNLRNCRPVKRLAAIGQQGEKAIANQIGQR